MNLRTRFALIAGVLVFILATVMSVGAYRIASSQLENQVQTSLEQRITRILNIMARPNFSWRDSFGPGPVNQAIMQTEVDAITQVVLPNGQVLGRREYPQLPIENADKALSFDGKRVHKSSTIIDGHTFRTMTVLANDGSLIQVAKDTQILIDARNGMRTWFPLFAALAVMVSAVIGWLFAGRVSKPIENLALTADDIAQTQDLERRITVSGKDEVARLSTSFNTMLSALQQSSDQQKQLVQDASHELRTPLTSLRANAELLQRDSLDDATKQAVLRDIAAEIDELTDLSSELTALASDQRLVEEPEEINLREACDDIATRASRRTGRTVSVTSTNPASVKVRPSQFDRAVGNLVDNALKFCPTPDNVEINIVGSRVEVIDHGQGIADADKHLVFDRFYRATATRALPGSGLGLAIVKQFADDHEAVVNVTDTPGGGATVVLTFVN